MDNDQGTRLLEKAERRAKLYEKKYASQMEMLESKSNILSRARTVTSYDKYVLGKQLEAFDGLKKMLEYDGSVNMLGVLPRIALTV